MPETKVLAPLLPVLADLIAWLKAEEVAGVVIGGLAASLLGRPRLTRDVDVLVVVDEGRWAGFLATGAKYGFVPRQRDTLAFAQQSRVLLVRHEPSGLDANVVFGSLPCERETVARAVWIDVGGILVPLPRPEDLIILKAVAHRPPAGLVGRQSRPPGAPGGQTASPPAGASQERSFTPGTGQNRPARETPAQDHPRVRMGLSTGDRRQLVAPAGLRSPVSGGQKDRLELFNPLASGRYLGP
jgi:hypothetical protein